MRGTWMLRENSSDVYNGREVVFLRKGGLGTQILYIWRIEQRHMKGLHSAARRRMLLDQGI